MATTERTADLIFLLSQAAHALTTELTAELEGLGITPRSHCVLTQALDGEQTQIQLAERCALDKTTMVVTIDELERAGLAERRPSPTDRRARIIAVTDAGREKVARGATRSSSASTPTSSARCRTASARRSWTGSRASSANAWPTPPRVRAASPPPARQIDLNQIVY